MIHCWAVGYFQLPTMDMTEWPQEPVMPSQQPRVLQALFEISNGVTDKRATTCTLLSKTQINTARMMPRELEPRPKHPPPQQQEEAIDDLRPLYPQNLMAKRGTLLNLYCGLRKLPTYGTRNFH